MGGMERGIRRERLWCQSFRTFVSDWKRKALNGESIGDEAFHNFVLTEKAKSWEHVLRWLDELQDSWCFRGQREAAWLLHTSLDWAVGRDRSSPNSFIRYHRTGKPKRGTCYIGSSNMPILISAMFRR